MTIVERVEKALDFLRATENGDKTHELQNNAGVLGQCMGALGNHTTMMSQYTALLQQSITVLLSLCCHNNPEVRLVAEEALNRVVVGGSFLHYSKIHFHFHNSITSDKHPRWLRAILSRIYLGKNWLRASTGRGRIYAQSTLIRLKDIIERVKDPLLISDKGDVLIMECLEGNLPRILKALSPYASREEMFALLLTLLTLIDSPTASIKRNSANCIADICRYHQKKFIPHVVNAALNNLQDKSTSHDTILGWFGTLKAIFNINPLSSLELSIVPLGKYMQMFYTCLYHIENTTNNHNILNAVMDCLNIIISDTHASFRLALLNSKGPCLLTTPKEKKNNKGHHRSMSSISMAHSVMSTASSMANLSEDLLLSEQSDNVTFHENLFNSISQNQTPHRSIEDISMKGLNTPDSPCESMISELNSEIINSDRFTNYFKEKIDKSKEFDDLQSVYTVGDDDLDESNMCKEMEGKVNIGSLYDEDIVLKYTARLLISRFLLNGYAGKVIPDALARVSVKASALSCLASVIEIYPDIMTMYLRIDDSVANNLNASFLSNNDPDSNDFVLERNICYQESLTDSFGQEFLRSVDFASQTSGNGSLKSGSSYKVLSTIAKKDVKPIDIDSAEHSPQVSSSNVENKLQNTVTNAMGASGMVASGISANSINLAMTASNFTMGSQTTTSNYPNSDLLSTSIDPLTSSLDLEMIFDHFGDSSNLAPEKQPVESSEIENFNLEQMVQDMLVTTENLNKYDEQFENETKGMDKDVMKDNIDSEIVTDPSKKSDNKESVLGVANAGFEESDCENTHQHMSDVFFILSHHSDSQIRGMVRLCLGSFLNSVCGITNGYYSKWKLWRCVSDDTLKSMSLENLLSILLKGITDAVPQCVNHSISALKKCFTSLFDHSEKSVVYILNSMRHVEKNSYWLCKVNLCNFYAEIDYKRISTLISDWSERCWQILEILIQFLDDQEPKVRKAAVNAITRFTPYFHPPVNFDMNASLIAFAYEQNENLLIYKHKKDIKLLSDLKNTLIFPNIPSSLNTIKSDEERSCMNKSDPTYANLKNVIKVLSHKLMTSQGKYSMQGCLESLMNLSLLYKPIEYSDAYCGLGLLDLSLQFLEYRMLPVSCTDILLTFVTQVYSVEAWNALCHGNNFNKRASLISLPAVISKESKNNWHQFECSQFATKADAFLKITLKLFNIVVHILQDITPQFIQIRSGIMPPSPLKKKIDDVQKRNITILNTDIPSLEERPKKKTSFSSTSGAFLPIGYFFNDSIFMRLYSNLKSAYSTHKVSVDPSTSVFFNFISTLLESFAVQLEFMSEKETESISEEILYYLRYMFLLKPDHAVSCVTQVVKSLFSTNVTAQRKNIQDFIFETNSCHKGTKHSLSIYNDVLINTNDGFCVAPSLQHDEQTFYRINDTIENRKINKLAEGFGKKMHLQAERSCYSSVKKYTKSKSDKEWTIQKQEYAKHLKLIEPIVILALKGYTLQNDVNMQCKVLELVNQILSLKVNYCFLNNDRTFIDIVLKQLEFIERCEMFECSKLVRCIFTFLIHLSTTEHHSKQLMDVPKLIQLCDGLMASEVYDECIEALHPLAYKIFLHQSVPGLNRVQIQEAQVTKEVLFSMLQKMMWNTKVVKLISAVLIFSEEHPESHYKWSQLVCDSLFLMLKNKTIDINSDESYVHLEKLFDCIHKDILFDQPKIESVLRIMFDNPPDQTSSLKLKERWLAAIILFLQKIIHNVAENEIFLSLNYLKTSFVSPASIFFNCHNEIDPLNVQSVNENCASLSSDVIFVRFIFRVLSYALLEMETCDEYELVEDKNSKRKNLFFWCKLCNMLMCQIKNIVHLKDGCRFPLLAKTSQTVLQNEQSGLNTGLYAPEENIPLKRLANVCIRLSSHYPILTTHWAHMMIRLKFHEQKYMIPLLGFTNTSNLSLYESQGNMNNDILQIGIFIALCEHFANNGLDEVFDFSWLLVNRIHFIVQFYSEDIVKDFIVIVNNNASASGLLLQAIAARCLPFIKGMYGLKVHNILSKCHLSQSGSLLFCICRFIGRLPISVAPYFMKLALKQCKYLTSLPIEDACEQITLDDIQFALEALHNDKVDKKYPELVYEFNNLACTLYTLSPLDIPLNRPINPHNIKTTVLDMEWLFSQLKSRCYKFSKNPVSYGKNASMACVLKSLSVTDLNTLFSSAEFDITIIQQTLRISTDDYIKELIDKISDQESLKIEKRQLLIERQISESEEYNVKDSFIDSNIFGFSTLNKLRKLKPQSQFFVTVDSSTESITEGKKNSLDLDEKSDIVLPELNALLMSSLKHSHKLILSIVSLFPKNFRPLSHQEIISLKENLTVDRYTKRCYMVFRDKYFHQLLLSVQGVLSAFFDCFKLIKMHLEHVDSDVYDKVIDLFLPKSLCSNLMQFSIISLQYCSYLIKNNEDQDVSSTILKLELSDFHHVLDLCVKNASLCFKLKTVVFELDTEDNKPKLFSAINCLYNYVKYLIKDQMPLYFKPIISNYDNVDDLTETAVTCDKLFTLISYWEMNSTRLTKYMSPIMKMHIEDLMISLCRCKLTCSFTLIPPCAWDSLQIFDTESKYKSNQELSNKSHTDNIRNKLENMFKSNLVIPIDILQDMDVLEQYLFRANLIGWINKKGFEEIWVNYLSALQGNGTHWAIRGMMQLLLTAHLFKCSRNQTLGNSRIKKMKHISIDCNFFNELFGDVNLENIPIGNQKIYTYSQVSIDYLKYASGLNELPDIKIQHISSQSKKMIQSTGIDINSCVQLFIDIASQNLTQSDWGLGARHALLSCIVNISDIFTNKLQWQWLLDLLSQMSLSSEYAGIFAQQYIVLGQAKAYCVLNTETPDVNQLTASLSSSFAPIRLSALHAAIMYLSSFNETTMLGADATMRTAYSQFINAVEVQLLNIIKPHLSFNAKVSLYEQSLCWTALFTLINCGNNEMLKIAVDFYFCNQNHYCADSILYGICNLALSKGGTLGNEITSIIFKAVDSNPEKCFKLLPLLYTQIYSGNEMQKSENVLEPEQLLVHLQTFATLQRAITLSPLKHSKFICRALLYYIKDYLPPAAVLNKIVSEFIDCCRWADSQYIDKNVYTQSNIGLKLVPFYVELLGNVVFEVFEESISQDQLLIFNGWLFDGLNHFLEEKILTNLIPFCLLSLITSASSNKFIRTMAPVANFVLRTGCTANYFEDKNGYDISHHFDNDNQLSLIPPEIKIGSKSVKMSFNDTRLLCLGALHSNFSKFQLEKLKILCVGKALLNDLRLSLDV